MDGQLRQIGVGDVIVGKHIGKMMAMLGGRLGAYRDSLSDDTAFDGALLRNLYRGVDPGTDAVTHVRESLAELHRLLEPVPVDRIASGNLP